VTQRDTTTEGHNSGPGAGSVPEQEEASMANAANPSRSSASTDTMTASQTIALVVGIVFSLIGIIGFAVTGTSDFAASNTDKTLLGFELNPLHNIVHLVIGVAGLLMWRTNAMAKTYGWALFAIYGATFVYGLFVVNSTSGANFLSLNDADNGLHLVAALVGLAAGVLSPSPSGERTRYRGHAPI
jgi:hypothetical protein